MGEEESYLKKSKRSTPNYPVSPIISSLKAGVTLPLELGQGLCLGALWELHVKPRLSIVLAYIHSQLIRSTICCWN